MSANNVSNAQKTVESQPSAKERELQLEIQLQKAKAHSEFQMTAAGQQVEVINAESDAKFMLTPVGQKVKEMETLSRFAQMYSRSTIVPVTYQGANGLSNCCIAIDMANRMNANPLMVMQNLYIVHGNPSWSSKFLIATINTCGRFKPLRYECNNKEGDDYGWRCVTYANEDKEMKNPLEGPWVTWSMVKAEKWDTKNGSKWNTMPEVMFRYRAAAFWQRLFAPEIGMGFNTVEEYQDMPEDVDYVEIDDKGNEVSHHKPMNSRENISAMARQRAKNQNKTKTEETIEIGASKEDAGIFVDTSTGEVMMEADTDLSKMSDTEFDKLMDNEPSFDFGENTAVK